MINTLMTPTYHTFLIQVIMLGNPGYISLAGLWFMVTESSIWKPVNEFLNGYYHEDEMI